MRLYPLQHTQDKNKRLGKRDLVVLRDVQLKAQKAFQTLV